MNLRCIPFGLSALICMVMVACSADKNNTEVTTHVTFLNVELEDASRYDHGAFQLYVNRDLVSSSMPCAMTHPLTPNNRCNEVDGSAGSYDSGSKQMRLNLQYDSSNIATDAVLNLNFDDPNNILVELDLNDSNPPLKGRARLAITRFTHTGHMDVDANGNVTKSAVFTVANVSPLQDSASIKLVRLDTTNTNPAPIFSLWSPPSTPPQATDLSYRNLYDNFRQVPLNNGYPQGNMGFVTKKIAFAEFEAGTFTSYLCTLMGAISCDADLTTTPPDPRLNKQNFSITLATFIDPEAAETIPDTTKLFAFGQRPSLLAEITILDNQAVPVTAATTPVDIGAGPYTLSWADTVQNPTTVDWQVSFTEYDTATSAAKRLTEIRTPRKIAGEQAGPTYDSINKRFSWTLHEDMAITPGATVEVHIRVYNSSRTMSADTAPFYLTVPAMLP